MSDLPTLNPDEIERLASLVKDKQKDQRIIYHASLSEQIIALIRNYEYETTQALAGVKCFRDDTRMWLQAMVIVANTIGNAGTHREKDARLRGMIEILETVIEKLRTEQSDFDSSYFRWPNLYRSEYPVRRYMERAEGAERQLQETEAKLKSFMRSVEIFCRARSRLLPEQDAAWADAIRAAQAEIEAEQGKLGNATDANVDDVSRIPF